MTSLTTLADKLGSDKGTTSIAHGYTKLYELLFFPYKHQEIRLLEMGLLRGGPEVKGGTADRSTDSVPSVEMWLEYFDKAHIFGLDISDFSWFEHPRFTFIQCDMDARENIRKMAKDFDAPLDIMIDDASHASHHQQMALVELWPHLKEGGIYIIEDLHWQPDTYEKPDYPKTGGMFMEYNRTGVLEHSDPSMAKALKKIEKEMGLAYVFPDGFRHRGKAKVQAIQKLTT